MVRAARGHGSKRPGPPELEAEIRSQSGATLGKCSLAGPQGNGKTAVGEIELVAAHPLLRGRVAGFAEGPAAIDLRGKVSASSTLTTGRRRQVAEVTVDGQGQGVSASREVVITAHPASGAAWGRLRMKLESADDGPFAIAAQLPPCEAQPRLKSEAHVLPGGDGTLITFPVGTDDVELVVTRNGWLQVDDSMLPEGFRRHFHLTTYRTELDEAGT